MKSILVATIGTRDLAYKNSDGIWLNIGNDRAQNGIPEMGQVKEDLATEPGVPTALENSNFRQLTQFLSENFSQYQARLIPIILGQLLQDTKDNLSKVYLMATDQNELVKEREKDTLYSADVIKQWIESNYQIPTQVILQGPEGYNPSNFEQMFSWWKQVWRQIANEIAEDTPILLCLKGGVGQSSEASRVTALSRFAEDSLFYDFKQDISRNSQGLPSEYFPPFKGTNYLWDRRQKEALGLLRQYDYEAVQRIIKDYYKNANPDTDSGQLLLRIKLLIEVAIQWNFSEFDIFSRNLGEQARVRSRQWWWKGYEAAYLAVIRFEQGNTVEALFHSFRAVEGLIAEWAEHYYHNDIEKYRNSPHLKRTICAKFPQYLNNLPEGMQRRFENEGRLGLYSTSLYELLKQAKPKWPSHPHIKFVWEVVAKIRNEQFHRLRGLDKKDLFEAWETPNRNGWEERVLSCLNFVSEQKFTSLKEASLMSIVHEELKEAISSYSP